MACLKRKYVKAEPKEGRAKGEREGRVRKYNLNPRSCVCVCVCTSTSKGVGCASWRLEFRWDRHRCRLSDTQRWQIISTCYLPFATCYLLLGPS
jgi:hypothetical protein